MDMTHDPMEFTVTDPRTYEGNPYEVAERAVKQMESLLGLTLVALDGAELMARNAYMERNLSERKPAGGSEWPDSPEGRRWTKLKATLIAQRPGVRALGAAAGFDPRHPPKV
jgi:hypothetical protein